MCLKNFIQAERTDSGAFIVELGGNETDRVTCVKLLSHIHKVRISSFLEEGDENSGITIHFEINPTPFFVLKQNFPSIEEVLYGLYLNLQPSSKEVISKKRIFMTTNVQYNFYFTLPVLLVSVHLFGEIDDDTLSDLNMLGSVLMPQLIGEPAFVQRFELEDIYETEFFEVSPKFIDLDDLVDTSKDIQPYGSDRLFGQLVYMSYNNFHIIDASKLGDRNFSIESFDFHRKHNEDGVAGTEE